ncbi:hypothetical protein LZD57_22935 [Jiella sp. CBK1P-4]|uniref:O-Antigen ligase n=1 Tax=Jiella avicenniae TaxID=2907202 RepID=A0A9X1T6P5_9HYPH|nr:hypothetical protein [Jiella avicenniae]
MIGRLTFAEVLLLVYLPFGYAKFRSLRLKVPREVKVVLVLGALWLAACLVTDAIRQTPFSDFSRGASKIVFLLSNFLGLVFLTRCRFDRALKLMSFLFVAAALKLALGYSGDELADEVAGAGWKFGYGQFATALVLLVASQLNRKAATRSLGIVLPFVIAGFSLLLNARNLTGLTALSGLVGLITAGRRRSMSRKSIALVGLAGIAAGGAVFQVYAFSASAGWLGPEAKDKYEHQYSGDLNFLEAGRTEYLSSIPAVKDSPIIGHGSWARDMDYVVLRIARLEAAGIKVTGDPFRGDLIPTHSHLMGAWVEHGILGAVFWIYILWICGSAAVMLLRRPSHLSGFLTFVVLSLVWDIFFSPFGLDRRIIDPAEILLIILILPSFAGSRESHRKRVNHEILHRHDLVQSARVSGARHPFGHQPVRGGH